MIKKRFFSIGLLMFISVWFSTHAQNLCIVSDTIERDIAISKSTFLGSNTFIARIHIVTCINEDHKVIFTISRHYTMDGEIIPENKITKHGHFLYVLDINFTPDNKFRLTTPIDGTMEMMNGGIFVFEPLDNTKWQNEVFSTSIKFKYMVKGEAKEDEISFSFDLPDNTAIELPKVEQIPINEEPVNPVKPKKDNTVAKPPAQKKQVIVAGYDAIDSLEYYFIKIADLSSLMDEVNAMVSTEKIKFINEYKEIKLKFYTHFGQVSNNAKGIYYKEEFDKFYSFIEKQAGTGSETETKTTPVATESNPDAEDNFDDPYEPDIEPGGITRTESFIIYLFVTAFGLSLLGFLYLKLRK